MRIVKERGDEGMKKPRQMTRVDITAKNGKWFVKRVGIVSGYIYESSRPLTHRETAEGYAAGMQERIDVDSEIRFALMGTRNEERRNEETMTKRTRFIKSDPPKPPPSIGDVVWYPDRKEAWRTGRLIRVIDRGKNWGKCEVRDSVSGSLVKVEPEHVRAI